MAGALEGKENWGERQLSEEFIMSGEWGDITGFAPVLDTMLQTSVLPYDIYGSCRLTYHDLAVKHGFDPCSSQIPAAFEVKIVWKNIKSCSGGEDGLQYSMMKSGVIHVVYAIRGSCDKIVPGTQCPVIAPEYISKKSAAKIDKRLKSLVPEELACGIDFLLKQITPVAGWYWKDHYGYLLEYLLALLKPGSRRGCELSLVWLCSKYLDLRVKRKGESDDDYFCRLYTEVDKFISCIEPYAGVIPEFDLQGLYIRKSSARKDSDRIMKAAVKKFESIYQVENPVDDSRITVIDSYAWDIIKHGNGDVDIRFKEGLVKKFDGLLSEKMKWRRIDSYGLDIHSNRYPQGELSISLPHPLQKMKEFYTEETKESVNLGGSKYPELRKMLKMQVSQNKKNQDKKAVIKKHDMEQKAAVVKKKKKKVRSCGIAETKKVLGEMKDVLQSGGSVPVQSETET